MIQYLAMDVLLKRKGFGACRIQLNMLIVNVTNDTCVILLGHLCELEGKIRRALQITLKTSSNTVKCGSEVV